MIIKQKVLRGDGRLRQWGVNEDLIKEIIPWAGDRPDLLREELDAMDKSWPFFYPTIGSQQSIKDNNIYCRNCGDIISFTDSDGLACVNCGTHYNPYRNPLLGFLGVIPSQVGRIDGELGGDATIKDARPILLEIHDRLRKMHDQRKKKAIRTYFIVDKRGNIYFAPVIFAFYPSNWPRSAPQMLVTREYFDDVLFAGYHLDYGDFHAYPSSSDKLVGLCYHSHWHKITMSRMLIERIQPKVVIDLIIADLMVVGKLRSVCNELGTSVHGLYNLIGRGKQKDRFRELYDRYVKIGR